MDAGNFEQIADCWSAERQPAIYYRTIAARARKLQADATTPRVRQYLDTMIAHCERLAGRVEPGVLSGKSALIGRSKMTATRRHLSRKAGSEVNPADTTVLPFATLD
jgi:hypothetical protein